MTARPSATASAPAARASRAGQHWPVIVLACPWSGAARIRHLLSDSTALACTSGTGLLPLCDQAAATWRRVGNRDGPLSPLAISSIRALAGPMISVILAGAGKSRWCEISSAMPAAAETFLHLYPGTKFVCLHRSCPDVIRAGIEAHPWGLAGTSLGQAAAAYPGSSAAAIAAYWAQYTGSLLRFEQEHPAACRQVRYENLTGHHDQEAEEIFTFLDLTRDDAASALGPDQTALPATEPGIPGHDTQLPPGHLPPPLTQQVNDLQASLGYPPVA